MGVIMANTRGKEKQKQKKAPCGTFDIAF